MWKDVKKEDIELILNRMEVKFDYPWSDAFFMNSIEQSMMAYLHDWCNMMQNHFTKMRSKRDIAFLKVNPYKNVPFDHWNILCDRFDSQELEGNPETEELISLIDYFKSCHLKPFGWQNEYTQEKYVEMVMSRAEVLTQTQSRAQSEFGDSASSTESVVGLEQVEEFQIMSKALGIRSRTQKGLGALSRLKSIGR
ncbi:hypothetical protein PanWU01x14_095430 [Parasponia andersonii]|uniref:Uncharacterized protein n=1 Tax=Parasponia andersonii TaxID=3476 RepID=A0A2P5D502_PARAD|nr:hypothetical protein PanWU01x14_095430 [Parasponia andersonii]